MSKYVSDYDEEYGFEDEAKYRKPTGSSKSDSKSKSKHKHTYKECLYECLNEKYGKIQYYHGTYCDQCGKVGDMKSETIHDEGKLFHRMMTSEEMIEHFGHLERVKINSIWDKYVPVTTTVTNKKKTEVSA